MMMILLLLLLFFLFFIFSKFSFISDQWLMISLLAMTKLVIVTALLVLYVATAEIFPTPVRSSGLGIMGVTGLVSMAIGPIILNVSHYIFYEPFQRHKTLQTSEHLPFIVHL